MHQKNDPQKQPCGDLTGQAHSHYAAHALCPECSLRVRCYDLAKDLTGKGVRPALLSPFARMFAPCSLLRPCERPYGQRRSPCAALALCPNVRPLLAAANLAKIKAVSLGQKCNGLAGLQPAALLHGSLHILLRLIDGFPRQSR